MTLSPTAVLEISAEDLTRFIQKMHTSPEAQAKLDFIEKAIPAIEMLSRTKREKIARCFNEVIFCPSHQLYKEGQSAN